MEENWKAMIEEVERKKKEAEDVDDDNKGGGVLQQLKTSMEEITVEESPITKLRERRRESKVLYRNVNFLLISFTWKIRKIRYNECSG